MPHNFASPKSAHPKTACPRLACLLALLSLPALATAESYVWDAVDTSNGTAIDAGSGTWNTAAKNPVWNHGGTNSPWAQASSTEARHSALFAGADAAEGTYTVTIEDSVAVSGANNGLWFDATGYLLTAPAPRTITAQTITTSLGKSAMLAGSLSVTPEGFEQLTINGRGTLRVRAGARLAPRNNLLNIRLGSNLVLETKGAVSTTSQVILGNGPESATPATITVSGGTMLLGTAGDRYAAPNNLVLANVNTGVASAVLTINSGTVENLGVGRGNSGESGLRFGQLVAGGKVSGTVNLNGGTLAVARLYEGNPGVHSTVNFNGGTLKVQTGATNASKFLADLDSVTIAEGGATIDTNGITTTIGQALTHAGASPVDGGLTKTGAGTLILNGGNTYTGPTTVTAGTLAVPAPDGRVSSILVRSGARFQAIAGTAAAALPGVVLEAKAALSLDLGAYKPERISSVVVSKLTTAGDYVVDLSGTGIPPGTYTVVSYVGKVGSGSPRVGAVPSGLTATVRDTGSAIVIEVVPRHAVQQSLPSRDPASTDSGAGATLVAQR